MVGRASPKQCRCKLVVDVLFFSPLYTPFCNSLVSTHSCCFFFICLFVCLFLVPFSHFNNTHRILSLVPGDLSEVFAVAGDLIASDNISSKHLDLG